MPPGVAQHRILAIDVHDDVSAGLDREGLKVVSVQAKPWFVPPAQQIDLVLVDIGMPTTSGLDVCRQLRQSYPTIPVVVIAAYQPAVDPTLRLDGWISAPTAPAKVAERVLQLVGHHHGWIKAPRVPRSAIEELTEGALLAEQEMEKLIADPLAFRDQDQTSTFLTPGRRSLVPGAPIPVGNRADAVKIYGHPRTRPSADDEAWQRRKESGQPTGEDEPG